MKGDEEDPAMEEKSEAAPPTLDIEAAMALEEAIVAALKTVYDPEIPVDIYELGLIYDVDVDGNKVKVRMTLTSPACPVAGSLPGEVEQKVQGVPGVEQAEVELVWDPPWNPGMMSEAARLELGMF
jgi:FeS assembly SUF system protein